MARALLIAEKPDLMRHVKAVYDKYGHKDIIDFESFAGHTMTLQSPEKYNAEWGGKWVLTNLPMIPSKFYYEPSKDKISLYNRIKDKIKHGNYDYLINCCDPGREGQHIFFSFIDSLNVNLPCKRMWHNDLTEPELHRALTNLRDEKEPELVNMTKASKLRADFDWLTGLNFTRVLSIKANIGKACNVGRVMTPTLKLIVDRELELLNFKPKDYWEVEATFDGYKGSYYTEEGKGQFLDKEEANRLISKLGKTGIVESVEQKKELKYAPRLYSLSSIQNDANKIYGYTMQETLGIVQELYEKKILSYPRTDSEYVTKAIAKDFTSIIKATKSIPDLVNIADRVLSDKAKISSMVNDKKYVDDKKVSDHYAIIFTGATFDIGRLTPKQVNIVNLVARRLLAIFLPPIASNKTNIVTTIDGEIFKTTGSVLLDEGFSILYGASFNDNVLPNVKKGDVVGVKSVDLIAKKTSPPLRYTDRTLNISMENAGRFVDDDELKEVLKEAKGLGTPATRGGIVEKLVDLQMIERKKKNFYATDFGISIIKSLGDFEITSPELTGIWEQKLRKIEECNYEPSLFEKEMIEYVKEATSKLKNFNIVIDNSEDSIGKCPVCGKNVKESKDYYICNAYKKGCNFIVPKTLFGAKIGKTDIKNLLAGKPTKELSFKKDDKSWKCKLMFDAKEKKVVFAGNNSTSNAKDLGVCPICGKPLKSSSKYFMCSEYKSPCTFLVAKELMGAKITDNDFKKLLKGDLVRKKFTWKSGKSSEASIKLNKDGKIEFVFN